MMSRDEHKPVVAHGMNENTKAILITAALVAAFVAALVLVPLPW
jgi:hypothetical protein